MQLTVSQVHKQAFSDFRRSLLQDSEFRSQSTIQFLDDLRTQTETVKHKSNGFT